MPTFYRILWNTWLFIKAGKVTEGGLTDGTFTCFYKGINANFNKFMFKQKEILS